MNGGSELKFRSQPQPQPQPQDRLLLNERYPYVIQRVGRYGDFEELLAHEDLAAIAPDVPPVQLLDALRAIYPPEKEALGAVALEIEKVTLQRSKNLCKVSFGL